MYKGYVSLLEKYAGKVEVLAFPCNQFGKQEPGTNAEIKDFAQKKYGFQGKLFDKVDVNGDGAHPLWKWLQVKLPGIMGTTSIKWNFSKFLIDENGVPVKRYGPKDKVQSMYPDIDELLEKSKPKE
eukprot:Sspe_Gene.63729::Locus_36845_Transcript_1_1_Confidence_1.000_Length_608::g.63729::m.63729/K00432/gpx; glutathione peroxidase